MQVFDRSTTVRKVIVIAENTMSKSKTVIKMTVAGQADDDVTDAHKLQWYCITSQVSFQPWVVSLRRLAGVGRGPQWLSTAVEAWLIDRA